MPEVTLAQVLFKLHRDILCRKVDERKSALIASGEWEKALQCASIDLDEWNKAKKEPVYLPESLAQARLVRVLANEYQAKSSLGLYLSDAEHQARIATDIFSSGFAKKLIDEGVLGRKLGIVEVSSRLAPVLTFNGSSAFFEVGLLPYGKDSRQKIGELTRSSYVSEDAAFESARNLVESFKVHYSLAETSAAPREDVPKSGRKPEIYICSIVDHEKSISHHVVNTSFRAEFNSIVRELMYQKLKEMYR